MSKDDKVLITGATGFVGSNIARRMVKGGYEVHILTRETSSLWRIKDILPVLKNHVVDLVDEEKLKRIMTAISPDVIFHLATVGIYGGVQSFDKKVIDTNLIGTMNLINACENIDYKCFINTGSSSEYGPKTHPMKETDVCNPINVYGISKCAAMMYGMYIAKTKNKPIIGFRLFSPYGVYDDKNRLAVYAIVSALQDKSIKLANKDAVRDYIYIDDVVEVYIKSIGLASELKGEIFNIASGSQTKSSYIIKKIMEFTNSKSEIKWNTFPGRDYDPKMWQADIEKASKLLGWKPKHNIDEGIRRTISWFEKNLDLYK